MTFLDHRGKTITLKEPPKRIVSMFASGPLVHAAVEGTTEHFVGVNVKGKKTYSNSIYAELMPELLKLNFDVAGEGFAPNVEAILALKPDAVLQWTFDPKIIEPLERVNLTVIGWDCCTKEQRRDYLRLAGYTANRIDRAQTILALQDKSENALRDLFAKAKLAKPTGMLVIDREKFGATDLPGETRRIHESGLLARIQYDQAVLNLVFKDKWLPLDFRWNLICPWPAHEALEPLLLHYTGHRKPWNLVSGVAFSNAYRHTMTNAVFYKFWRERMKRRLLAPFKKLMGR